MIKNKYLAFEIDLHQTRLVHQTSLHRATDSKTFK